MVVDVHTELLSEEDDADQDGILNDDERLISTDPKRADTDGDGLEDGEELLLGADPTDVDTDRDSLEDGEEIDLEIDPLDPDTDAGGRWDGEEIEEGKDPLDPSDDGRPTVVGTFYGGGGCDQRGSAPIWVATPLLPLLVALRVRR